MAPCPPHSRDGLDHVDPHLHAAVRMVPTRLRQPRHAVVAVPQDLDAQAVVLLGGVGGGKGDSREAGQVRTGGSGPPNPLPRLTAHRRQLVEAREELVERHHQLLRRALRRQAGEALDVREEDAVGRKGTGWKWLGEGDTTTTPPPETSPTPPRVPDVVVLLDVDLVEHHVLLLGVDVLLHLHGHVLGQHREQQALLRPPPPRQPPGSPLPPPPRGPRCPLGPPPPNPSWCPQPCPTCCRFSRWRCSRAWM